MCSSIQGLGGLSAGSQANKRNGADSKLKPLEAQAAFEARKARMDRSQPKKSKPPIRPPLVVGVNHTDRRKIAKALRYQGKIPPISEAQAARLLGGMKCHYCQRLVRECTCTIDDGTPLPWK